MVIMKSNPRLLQVIVWMRIFAAVILLSLPGCSSLSSEKVSAYNPSTQNDDALIATLSSSLWSSELEVRTDSEKKLIDFAQSSPAKRELVINKLLNSVNAESELDGTHTVLDTSFLFWTSVTNIFVELNATEAIDVLIRCVHCSNGMTGNFGEPPASFALVRMGKPILPRLAKALNLESDSYKRIRIVLCISRIGGTEAVSDLEQALQSESHRDVRELIEFNLSQMKSKR